MKRQHPYLRVIEYQAPQRPLGFVEAWLHPVLFALFVVLLVAMILWAGGSLQIGVQP